MNEIWDADHTSTYEGYLDTAGHGAGLFHSDGDGEGDGHNTDGYIGNGYGSGDGADRNSSLGNGRASSELIRYKIEKPRAGAFLKEK